MEGDEQGKGWLHHGFSGVEQRSFHVGSSRSDISCAFDFMVVRPGFAGELAKFMPLNTLPLG